MNRTESKLAALSGMQKAIVDQPTESLISRYQNDTMSGVIMENPFITLMNCPSCGNCMWGYENNKIVCAVCGYSAKRSEE